MKVRTRGMRVYNLTLLLYSIKSALQCMRSAFRAQNHGHSDKFITNPSYGSALSSRTTAFQYFSKRSRSTTMIVAPPISTGIGIVV